MYLLYKFMPRCLCKSNRDTHKTSTKIAKINSCPPSPFDSIPITSMWDNIAPVINPTPKRAPIKALVGISKRTPVISSIIPVPMRPQN